MTVPSKKLMGVWAFVDTCLLIAGILTLVVSIVWRTPDLIRDLIISKADLTVGLVLAIVLLVTWAFSIGAIIQPNHVTQPLKVLNWILLLDVIGVTVIGSFVWFYTLQERANFHEVFAAQSDDQKVLIQNALKCCGYFNITDLVVVRDGSFCANETFVQTTINSTSNFCVTPLTAKADYTLNNIFTSVYGYMAIILCLFLASLCVINKRYEAERFRKIDEKRGGRGFV